MLRSHKLNKSDTHTHTHRFKRGSVFCLWIMRKDKQLLDVFLLLQVKCDKEKNPKVWSCSIDSSVSLNFVLFSNQRQSADSSIHWLVVWFLNINQLSQTEDRVPEPQSLHTAAAVWWLRRLVSNQRSAGQSSVDHLIDYGLTHSPASLLICGSLLLGCIVSSSSSFRSRSMLSSSSSSSLLFRGVHVILFSFFSLRRALANQVDTCVRVILVMMASMIFSPLVGYGFLRCSLSQAFSVAVASRVAFFL